MPAPIANVGHLVEVIRAQLAARSRTSSARQKDDPSKSATANRNTSQNLGTVISSRIASIDPDDLQKGRKAFRIFLECVLLSRLGENMINDPGFYQMVDDIQSAMEADPETRQAIEIAIDSLIPR